MTSTEHGQQAFDQAQRERRMNMGIPVTAPQVERIPEKRTKLEVWRDLALALFFTWAFAAAMVATVLALAGALAIGNAINSDTGTNDPGTATESPYIID